MSTVSNPARTPVGTTAIQALAANDQRTRLVLQNLGTTVLKIVLGATNPTATVYHFAMAANATADSGASPPILLDLYRGEVRAISSVAGGALSVVEEF